MTKDSQKKYFQNKSQATCHQQTQEEQEAQRQEVQRLQVLLTMKLN